jgi:hypothetical protein
MMRMFKERKVEEVEANLGSSIFRGHHAKKNVLERGC